MSCAICEELKVLLDEADRKAAALGVLSLEALPFLSQSARLRILFQQHRRENPDCGQGPRGSRIG